MNSFQTSLSVVKNEETKAQKVPHTLGDKSYNMYRDLLRWYHIIKC